MLLSIALFPLLAPAFWHHHYPKVSAAWSAVVIVPFVLAYGAPALRELAHVAVVDYVPFIILLGALFTIGGGIYVRGGLRGTPWVNGTLMLIGTLLASWVGTTGAAMLLVRPLLRANRERRHRAHTLVFFIFLVANIGGALTPLGDPPLFLRFLHGVPQQRQSLVRAAILLLMLAASWRTTPRRVREENQFTWEPIREVAILFAGIFATIIPVLAMLRVGEQGALAFVIRAVREPAHFFWASGILSSFLDNAPTYLTFLSTALGRLYPGVAEREAIHRLIAENHAFLQAIATGSVFMGANTYIGNAPNFMVKSIAEEAGVPMPSFFGYILRYSLPVLIPVFALATLVFFE